MKRRGFFSAFAGLIAAPVAAKAIEELPKAASGGAERALLDTESVLPETGIVYTKRDLGDVRYSESFCTMVSAGAFSQPSARWDDRAACEYCGRIGLRYSECQGCGAQI